MCTCYRIDKITANEQSKNDQSKLEGDDILGVPALLDADVAPAVSVTFLTKSTHKSVVLTRRLPGTQT